MVAPQCGEFLGYLLRQEAVLRIKRRKSEQGVALVTALCLLMMVSLLAGSAVILSQYAEKDSFTFSNFTRSAYVAEGVGNRIYWLILNDRKKNPQRSIVPDSNAAEDETERYVADGAIRELKDYAGQTVSYRITDAVSGLDVSGTMPDRDLIATVNHFDTNSEERQKYETIGNRMRDYVDSDDLVRLNSMEVKEYQEAELAHLPRNQQFQFREELLWIPGIREVCQPDESGRMTGVRIIAPKGLPAVAGRPSLYSTPASQIVDRCHLNPLEAEQLNEAFSLWRSEKKKLQDSLPAGFLKRLEMYYNNSESGFYTILIDTSDSQQPGMRLALTFKVEFGNKKIREFYEYMLY